MRICLETSKFAFAVAAEQFRNGHALSPEYEHEMGNDALATRHI